MTGLSLNLGLGLSRRAALTNQILRLAQSAGDLALFVDFTNPSNYTLNGSDQIIEVQDLSPNGFTGTEDNPSGTPPPLVSIGTKGLTAADFDGSNDVFTFGDVLDWDPTVDDIMVMFVADLDDVTTSSLAPISKQDRDSPFQGWGMVISGGTVSIAARQTGGTNVLNVNAPITTGERVVTAQIKNTNEPKIWVDGVEGTLTTVVNTLTSLDGTAVPLSIGSRRRVTSGTWDNFLNGRIGHMIVWIGDIPTLAQKQQLEAAMEDHYG